MLVLERENAYSNGKKPKYIFPSEFNYEEVRKLFKNPEVTKVDDIGEFKWNKPDEEGIKDFLIREKGFNEEKVDTALKKLLKH